jgi:hypothetical protein
MSSSRNDQDQSAHSVHVGACKRLEDLAEDLTAMAEGARVMGMMGTCVRLQLLADEIRHATENAGKAFQNAHYQTSVQTALRMLDACAAVDARRTGDAA